MGETVGSSRESKQMSKAISVAIIGNFLAAIALVVARTYWAEMVDPLLWVYFFTSLVFTLVVFGGRRRPAGTPAGYLRITRPGQYRLLKEFVALANPAMEVFPAGSLFTVTRTARDDSVVYIPEFGGWTYCEIPAQPAKSPFWHWLESMTHHGWGH